MPRVLPTMSQPPRLDEVVMRWVNQYGEAISQTKAAELLGHDRATICRMVKAGTLPSTPLKHVLVAPLAEWAYKDYCNSRSARKRIAL